MKFYLSSFGIGNEGEKLKNMAPKNNEKVAYISNALDASTDLEGRKQTEQKNVDALTKLSFQVEQLDLRNYFHKQKELEKKIREYGVLWISGGNTFVLRQAMKLSGLDSILRSLQDTDLVYAGYSAAICILGPTLKNLQIVDDPHAKPYGDESQVLWDGLNMIDYSILPHYDSDHPESKDIDKEIQYCIDNNIPYKPLRDGDVIIIE